MEAKKIATIVANVSVGFIVVLVGLAMLSFPLNIIWGFFNVWLWIVSPTTILWAKKKEDEKELTKAAGNSATPRIVLHQCKEEYFIGDESLQPIEP